MTSSIIKYKNNNIVPHRIASKLKKLNVDLSEGKWKNFAIEQIIPFIEEWNLQGLWIYNNYIPTIIKQIKVLEFPQLMLINLEGNDLQSIEEISQINMPFLEFLYLEKNQIFCIKELRKGYWNNLRKISLTKNKILEGSVLSEVSSKRLMRLVINDSFLKTQKQCGDSFSWMVKLQSTQIKDIVLKSDGTLFSEKTKGFLNIRFNFPFFAPAVY